MPEISLAIAMLVLVLLFAQIRLKARSQRSARPTTAVENASLEQMTALVGRLAPTLREPAGVTASPSYTESGHVWASSCGKRVYLN